MSLKPSQFDYEPVRPSKRTGKFKGSNASETDDVALTHEPEGRVVTNWATEENRFSQKTPPIISLRETSQVRWIGEHGHALSFTGLFLFTVVLYFRPYELTPALSWTSTSAYWIALATLVIFIPAQISLEGNVTARPREVSLLLLLTVAALLSIPLAVDPSEAWKTFNDSFVKVVVMFVVMVNVVRTRRRLKALVYLAIAVSLIVSVNAINDYRNGRLELRGVRIEGSLGGMFENPNDLATHLVIIIPLVFALIPLTRNVLLKILYATFAILIVSGVVVTFSRGGFLGLVAGLGFFTFKIFRRSRGVGLGLAAIALVAFLVLAPVGYGDRVATILSSGSDITGSSGAREQLLVRSALVTLRHPLVGVGMGNFHFHSIHEQVTHNSYTQVGSELGIPAMLLYTMFIFAPLRKLRQIEEETVESGDKTWFHWTSLGLQAGLVAYLVASFFGSFSYLWYLYYLVGYAVCLRRVYVSAVKTTIPWP